MSLNDVKEEIRDELSSFGFDGDNDTIEQLSILAARYSVDAREISDEWIAHVYSKNINSSYDMKENMAIFADKLKSIILSKNSTLENSKLPAPSLNLSGLQEKSSQMLTPFNKNNISLISDEENDELMSIYGITPIQPKKSRTNFFNLDTTKNASPIVLGNNNSTQSPIVSLVGGNSQRTSGELLATFYNKNIKFDQTIINSTEKPTLDFHENSLTTLTKVEHCYMNQPLKSKAIIINKNIITIADEIKCRYDLQFEQYHPVFLPSSLASARRNSTDEIIDEHQSNFCVYIRGRICSQKVDGKLSHSHIYLEGCIDVSKGKRVQLFFSDSTVQYSLFPGQVVIVYGYHDSQEKEVFHVNNIYYETTLSNVGDILSQDQLDLLFKPIPCNLFVASGPFIIVDPNRTEPPPNSGDGDKTNTANYYIKCDFLQQLHMVVESNNIKTLILTGPFITIENDQLAAMRSSVNVCIFSQLYGQLFSFLNSMVKKLDIDQLVLIPSNQDLYTTHIYPLISTTAAAGSGSFFTSLLAQNNINISDKIIFSSCPTTFKLNNGLSCCVTGVDTLHHLSSFEVNKVSHSGQACDRISRLIQHCFHQRNLYPLYPSYQKMNLDLQMNRLYGKPQNNQDNLPHILIMPSNLKYFLKNVNGCLVINPGKFVKGHSLGSYSRLSLTSKINQNRVTIDEGCSVAAIIKL